MMTPGDVVERVGQIAAVADDDEDAHCKEDHLYIDILQAIADGEIADAQACAREALKVRDMDFSRWCA